MSALILCHAYGDVPDAPAISIECKKKENSKHRNKEFFRILYNGNDVLLMFLERWLQHGTQIVKEVHLTSMIPHLSYYGERR